MNELKFGKYSGKSFDFMLKNQKSYCLFVLNQKDCYGMFKEFQDFIKENINMLYNINELQNISSINCSNLIPYMFNDQNVIDIIIDIEIKTINQEIIYRNNNIPSTLFGQFIDYLIRYEISKLQLIKFIDNRTESIIDHGYGCNYELDNIIKKNIWIELIEFNNINNIYNIDEIYKNNEEKINNIVKSSDKNKTEIKNIIIEYYNRKNTYKNINESYLKLQNNNNVSLIDILNVSIAHSLSFGTTEHIEFINYNNEILNKKSYDNIVNYIKPKLNNKINIKLNPNLGIQNLGIKADADLIIDNELIDIKISSSIGLNINNFIQLIVYAVLYYIHSNIICEQISIYNPLLGKENYIIINIEIINKFINILKNYKIGKSNGNLELYYKK